MYGLALALPPLFAVGISLWGQHDLLQPGPEAPYSELSSALAWLLVGSALAQLLSYASVLAVQLLATEAEKDNVAKFITGLFIARIPLLLFQAVQAALLPKLAGLASEGKHEDFRAGMRRLLVVVVAICVAGTVAATVLGPWAGRTLFPSKWILGRPRHVLADARRDGVHSRVDARPGIDRVEGVRPGRGRVDRGHRRLRS